MDSQSFAKMYEELQAKSAATPTPAPTQAPAQPPVQPQVQEAQPSQKMFSGSNLQKAFDVLNVPLYAQAGFVQGGIEEAKRQGVYEKAPIQALGSIPSVIGAGVSSVAKNFLRFPWEWERKEFSQAPGQVDIGKELGLQNKYTKGAVNFATSLAAPSLALGGVHKAVRATPFLGKAVQAGEKVLSKGVTKTVDFARKAPVVSDLISMVNPYFKTKGLGEIINKMDVNTGKRVSKLFNQITDATQGLKDDELEEIGKIIEGISPVTDANRHLVSRANYIRSITDEVGNELVGLRLMSKKTFEKYKGQYLPRFMEQASPEELQKTGMFGKFKQQAGRFMKREGKLGSEGYPDYIRQVQYPVFKGTAGEIATAESKKALNEIATQFGTKASKGEQIAGHVKMSEIIPTGVLRHGLRNVYIPTEVAQALKTRYATAGTGFWDRIGKASDKALSYWKYGKTLLNPAYHSRNLMSNMILSDMSTGDGLAKTIAQYTRAVKAYKGGKDPEMNQYIQELRDSGVIGRVSMAEGVEKLQPGVFGKNKNVLQKTMSFPKDLQNKMEETAKLNVYASWRKKGLGIEEAVKKAEEAIFSPYNISQTERGLVKGVVPFYSFTRQALPFTAKTALNAPGRLTKYERARSAIESLSEEEKGGRPKAAEDLIRLPYKGAAGETKYFDPTYIYPFGTFGEFGDGGASLPFGLSLNPFAMEAAQQVFNKDLYYDKPIKKSASSKIGFKQRLEHGVRTLAPALYTTIGYPVSGLPEQAQNLYAAGRNIPDWAGRKRSVPEALLKAGGIKIQSYVPEEQKRFETQKIQTQIKDLKSEIKQVMREKRLTIQEKRDRVNILQEELRNLQSSLQK